MPEEYWYLVRGLDKSERCEFCWATLLKGKWAYKSSLREAFECSGCRKEGVRAQTASLQPSPAPLVASVVCSAAKYRWQS
jgi:hypothetical protein